MRRFLKRIYAVFIWAIIGIFLLLGGWCLPPKMTEKVVNSLKAKHQVEEVDRDISGGPSV